MMDPYFEDVTVGAQRTLGSASVSGAEIDAFTDEFGWDPTQVGFGHGADAADGDRVAGTWLVAGVTMRVLVENYLEASGALGSPGIERMRWPAPVRAGDELFVEMETIDKADWDEYRGLVTNRVTARLANDDVAMEMDAQGLYPHRDAQS